MALRVQMWTSGPESFGKMKSWKLTRRQSSAKMRRDVYRKKFDCRCSYPEFIPENPAAEITENAARSMLKRMQRTNLDVPSLGRVKTAYVSYPYNGQANNSNNLQKPAFVLLHGFDSSMLEFRRFAPILSEVGDTFAVDLAGWGFSDCGFADNADQALGPDQKRDHLKTFLEEVVGRPVILVGTSLGGAVAIDFASQHQDLVEKMILIDAQGFIDGIGPLAKMPRFLSVLGVQVLRSIPLRQLANKMAYHNEGKYATDDAMRVGRLHTFLPGWTEANVAFMQSGGYVGLSDRMKSLDIETLVVWGRQDEILAPDFAQRFIDTLPNARLEWIEECGHVPALEQPQMLLESFKQFAAAESSILAMN